MKYKNTSVDLLPNVTVTKDEAFQARSGFPLLSVVEKKESGVVRRKPEKEHYAGAPGTVGSQPHLGERRLAPLGC